MNHHQYFDFASLPCLNVSIRCSLSLKIFNGQRWWFRVSLTCDQKVSPSNLLFQTRSFSCESPKKLITAPAGISLLTFSLGIVWIMSEFQSIISSSIKAQLDSISYFGTITWWQNYCLSLSDIAMKVFLAQTARLRPTPNARHSPTTSTKISRWNSSGPHNANVEMAFFTLIHSHFFQTRILMFTSKASA